MAKIKRQNTKSDELKKRTRTKGWQEQMQGLGAEGMWKHQQLGKRRSSLEVQGNCTKILTLHCMDVSLCLPALLHHYDQSHGLYCLWLFRAACGCPAHMVLTCAVGCRTPPPWVPRHLDSCWQFRNWARLCKQAVKIAPKDIGCSWLSGIKYESMQRCETRTLSRSWPRRNSIHVLTRENLFLAGRNSFVCLQRQSSAQVLETWVGALVLPVSIIPSSTAFKMITLHALPFLFGN